MFQTSASHSQNEKRAWEIASNVPDPELVVLNIAELGILRNVSLSTAGVAQVEITPTYCGCAATPQIKQSIVEALQDEGFEATVKQVLNPPWTSDWISEQGRIKMRAHGIAPPSSTEAGSSCFQREQMPLSQYLLVPELPACPHCGNENTERISAFGSTPCKALHRCLACTEPFEYFKPI